MCSGGISFSRVLVLEAVCVMDGLEREVGVPGPGHLERVGRAARERTLQAPLPLSGLLRGAEGPGRRRRVGREMAAACPCHLSHALS